MTVQSTRRPHAPFKMIKISYLLITACILSITLLQM